MEGTNVGSNMEASNSMEELMELRQRLITNYDELQQLYLHVSAINEKLDAVLCLLQKKPRRNTISEVNNKIDGLIDFISTKKE